MQNYSYYLYLKIWHPTIRPEVITQELGINPRRTCMVGEQRSTPKGNKLDGLYKESYWVADPFGREEYSSTDDVAEDSLIEVISYLRPYENFLNTLREEGGRIHLTLSSVSNRNYAIELAPEVLSLISSLGISIVHDVYQ
jgi:hypothetical protein